ncbi:hypothetical protein LTR62_008320 [Meristemomyces frigidus]|uniref:Uncharacterized protein n=1 Tax=Meristemomyces frigidus TaxID=1508187 RepID=A0AAN7YLX5_9PEZI|nr:hypothetical protein LTR62_008320 [Meristemomyces frigidus]
MELKEAPPPMTVGCRVTPVQSLRAQANDKAAYPITRGWKYGQQPVHIHHLAHTASNTSPRRHKAFQPVNTLSSPHKPTFGPNTELYDLSKLGNALDWSVKIDDMVKERESEITSPQKRQPLANISAKMQGPSPKNSTTDDEVDFSMLKPLEPQAEFGKASPLRNPLRKPAAAGLFIPKKPIHRPAPHSQFMSSAAQQAISPPSQSTFYLPGQVPAQAPSASVNVRPQPVWQPFNQPQRTSYQQPHTQPVFSSTNPPYRPLHPLQPPRPVIDLTKTNDDDDDNSFDPDAAIREGQKFGEPDPYSYVDSTQANENIKNLLEGAFDDDEDKSRTRLRKRAKRALEAGKSKEAKGLAEKLAALKVEDKITAESAEDAEEEDEEDGTVEGMTVKLLPHQVEGVSWMIDKEIGKVKARGVVPYGGILADDMGLGKTVQSVALILTNARPAQDAKPEHPKQKMPGKDVSKSTLVVAPLALIKQWEDEIKTKVTRSHALRVLVHHGANRTKSAAELKKYDVVITTYQTLTSEHAGSQMGVEGGSRIGCFGVHWYRIMLDEAHSIKNRNAKSTQACYALLSWYRWCLSGTPMQNNLDELQSLIKFLRIKPYCEMPKWKADITQPMKNGRGVLAMKRLQAFLRIFMKRRTKDILKQSGALNFGGKMKEGEAPKGGMQIVKREVVTVDCEFDEAEREFYDRLQNRADARLQQMMNSGNNDYIGALVLLLRLRQACNHIQLIEMAANKNGNGDVKEVMGRAQSQDDDMDDLTRLMGGVSVETKKCDVCQVTMTDDALRCVDCTADILMMKKSKKKSRTKAPVKKEASRRQHQLPADSDEEVEGEWVGAGPERKIDLGKAGGTDDEDADGGGETLDSIDSDRSTDDDENINDSLPRARQCRPALKEEECTSEDDSTDDSDSSSSPAPTSSRRHTKTEHKPSSKIRRLLRILHVECPDHKVIVFSQFTTMLDLIEPHLRNAGLLHVRYDGSMRNDAREASLHALRTDKKCRVLLCSLKCGSLGLNLTAASRVVIVEPFWNPFVEEQAIDRVHRLNQTVDVRVYRLTVTQTVEERIIALQERKRELAKAAIEGAGNSISKLTMQEILGLFKHDAGHSGAEHEEGDREMMRKFGGEGGVLSQKAGRVEDGGRGGVGGAVDRRAGGGQSGGGGRGKEHDVFGRRW